MTELNEELKSKEGLKEAVFGAGCFWGVEEVFSKTKGIYFTEVGYTGGNTENPTYEDVCTGNTGHAEVVRVLYNPEEISYAQLLEVFFSSHDPTTLNRQGPDIGTQYRSVIFYPDDEDKAIADFVIEQLNQPDKLPAPVVTTVERLDTFYRAEEYHQQYFKKHPGYACHI